MKTLIYQIEFFSFWHTGSGLSGGADANLSVIKNQYGLPYIPGRTLKGLLREAADNIHRLNPALVTKDFIGNVFGIGEDHTGGEKFVAAKSFFTNGEFSRYLSLQLTEQQKTLLFNTIASTAIDKNGQAKDQSLRQIETAIPMTLYAAIENFPDDEASFAQMTRAMQWVKRMGLGRSRGWGRCKWSIINVNSDQP